MTASARKSKMISIRVSADEHKKLCEACTVHKISSVSELARLAMAALISPKTGLLTPGQQLLELRDRVQSLTAELDRLTRDIDVHAIE